MRKRVLRINWKGCCVKSKMADGRPRETAVWPLSVAGEAPRPPPNTYKCTYSLAPASSPSQLVSSVFLVSVSMADRARIDSQNVFFHWITLKTNNGVATPTLYMLWRSVTWRRLRLDFARFSSFSHSPKLQQNFHAFQCHVRRKSRFRNPRDFHKFQ